VKGDEYQNRPQSEIGFCSIFLLSFENDEETTTSPSTNENDEENTTSSSINEKNQVNTHRHPQLPKKCTEMGAGDCVWFHRAALFRQSQLTHIASLCPGVAFCCT
jgi:hypothetical protein